MVGCCLCGVAIDPNRSNTCADCLKSQVDITAEISKQERIYFCKSCGRYSNDEIKYISADLESTELLALCLKTIRGLGKGKGKSASARIVDATWKWTEPHSMRLKINMIVEKELTDYNDVVVQQPLQTEFEVKYHMCLDCTKESTNQQWSTRVQLRQKVSHKKTLLNLEQKLRTSPTIKPGNVTLHL